MRLYDAKHTYPLEGQIYTGKTAEGREVNGRRASRETGSLLRLKAGVGISRWITAAVKSS